MDWLEILSGVTTDLITAATIGMFSSIWVFLGGKKKDEKTGKENEKRKKIGLCLGVG